MPETKVIHASHRVIHSERHGGPMLHTQCGEVSHSVMIAPCWLLALRDLQRQEPKARMGQLCDKCLNVLMGDTS